MGEMVDGFVSHAKLGQVKPAFAPTEMEPLVRAVLAELLAKTGPATPELELHPLPVAWGDETLLRQVWANLLGNALKFSRQRATPRLEIGARAEAGRTIYFVRDNGTGFDMNDAGRLFSPFQRLHHADDFPGHGLGLATVERILRAHGGRIWAEARPDQGATFFFTLPLRPPVELRSRTPVAAFAEQQA